MGRSARSPNRLAPSPALAGVLTSLGVDSLAVTDTVSADERARLTLDLYPVELESLEAAAATLGVSAMKLARAIIRGWLATDWHHATLTGRPWRAAIKALRSEVLWWTEGAPPTASEVALANLSRLSPDDLLRVLVGAAGQLEPDARDELRRGLD